MNISHRKAMSRPEDPKDNSTISKYFVAQAIQAVHIPPSRTSPISLETCTIWTHPDDEPMLIDDETEMDSYRSNSVTIVNHPEFPDLDGRYDVFCRDSSEDLPRAERFDKISTDICGDVFLVKSAHGAANDQTRDPGYVDVPSAFIDMDVVGVVLEYWRRLRRQMEGELPFQGGKFGGRKVEGLELEEKVARKDFKVDYNNLVVDLDPSD